MAIHSRRPILAKIKPPESETAMKYLILIAAILSLPLTYADELYSRAMEMQAKRIGKSIFRYVRYNSEAYPCLRLELIDPKSEWTIIEKKEICEVNGISLREDVSYAAFEDIAIKNNKLIYSINYIDKISPGEYRITCETEIHESKIMDPQCHGPAPAD